MKIAIHCPRASYFKGGTERYALNLSSMLQQNGEKITLVTYDAPEKSEWFNKFKKGFAGNIFLVKSKELNERFKAFKKASTPSLWDEESELFSKKSEDFYKKNYFDLIIFHYAVDCLYSQKRKKCLHLHGLPDKKRENENLAIEIPDVIIAVSNYVGGGWKNLHKINKKIWVVYNGIDLNQKIYKIDKKEIDILYFGRLIKIKGIDILLKAIENLSKDFANLKVKIIGEGPEKESLITLTNKLGIEDNVQFLGEVKEHELKKAVASSKMCIFPSYLREGIMTTILEASLMGSPIIASNSCSNPEFIKEGYNGLLFKEGDAKDLSKKIRRLLLNRKLGEKLSMRSYEKVKKFSWEKQIKKLIKIYRNA